MKVLVVEDDVRMAGLLRRGLAEKAGPSTWWGMLWTRATP